MPIEQETRAAAQDVRVLYTAALDALPGHVLIVDADDRLTYANHTTRQRLAGDPVGQHLLAMCAHQFGFDDEQQAALSRALASVRAAAPAPQAVDVELPQWMVRVASLATASLGHVLITLDDHRAARHLEASLVQTKLELRQLVAHAEHVKEDERKRIARDIHDELGQNLLALRIDAQMLHARSAGHARLQAKVGAALAQIDASVQAVRTIINDLRPAVLDLGLAAALVWQARDFAQRSGIACNVVVDGVALDDDLDEERATALFRIIQEALNNVARHANARHVGIALRRQHHLLQVDVQDDGVGLPAGNRRRPNTFGLLGIRERLANLDGELRVTGHPGQGTLLTISLPCRASPPA